MAGERTACGSPAHVPAGHYIYAGQPMFTALPCTGVCRDEEPPQAFYRKPCVNSMPAISIITCGGRCFEVRTLVIIQLTNTRSKRPKKRAFSESRERMHRVQPADLVMDLPHTLSPRLTMIIEFTHFCFNHVNVVMIFGSNDGRVGSATWRRSRPS